MSNSRTIAGTTTVNAFDRMANAKKDETPQFLLRRPFFPHYTIQMGENERSNNEPLD